MSGSGLSRPLVEPRAGFALPAQVPPLEEEPSVTPAGGTGLRGAPVRTDPSAATRACLGARRLPGRPRSVRCVGPGGEQAAVTQRLRDGLPARAAVKQRHDAPTVESVRAEPVHLHPGHGERADPSDGECAVPSHGDRGGTSP